jgi:hypothetical protein
MVDLVFIFYYIKKRVEKEFIIYNSLLYGYNKFSLDILEYCVPNLLIKIKPCKNLSKAKGEEAK